MKGNVWIVGYAIVSLLLIGAAAAFSFSNKSKFADADRGWSSLKKNIATLEAKPLYPNAENLEKVKNTRSEYQAKVDTLFSSLKGFEKELDLSVTDSVFPQKLRKYVEDFKKRSREEDFEIVGSEGFYLGMEAYATDIPSQKLVPLLDYQLSAFNYLANMMADSGVSKITSLTRDNLPGERGAEPAPDPLPAVMRYPMRFEFEAGHDEFQTFINKLANDTEYFMVLRVLRIENTAKDGPSRDQGNGSTTFYPKYVDREGGEITEEQLREIGWPDVEGGELRAAALENGWVPAVQDAVVLFGKEKVIVSGVIDLVRFTPPSEAAAPAEMAKK